MRLDIVKIEKLRFSVFENLEKISLEEPEFEMPNYNSVFFKDDHDILYFSGTFIEKVSNINLYPYTIKNNRIVRVDQFEEENVLSDFRLESNAIMNFSNSYLRVMIDEKDFAYLIFDQLNEEGINKLVKNTRTFLMKKQEIREVVSSLKDVYGNLSIKTVIKDEIQIKTSIKDYDVTVKLLKNNYEINFTRLESFKATKKKFSYRTDRKNIGLKKYLKKIRTLVL